MSRLPRATPWLLAFLSFAVPATAADIRTAGPAPSSLGAGAVALTDEGYVLAWGGGTASAWDPHTLRWDPMHPATAQRYFPTATATRRGDVVVVGGLENDDLRFGARAALATTLSWHPQPVPADRGFGLAGVRDAGEWSTGPALLEARVGHAATLLADDDLLVTGGAGRADRSGALGPMLASVERLGRNGSRRMAPMAQARANHSACVLPDGRVLVAGGRGDDGLALRSVEIYDPAGDRWSPGPALLAARTSHTATLLEDGSVLVAGGFDEHGRPLRSSERLPAGGTRWEDAGELDMPRAGHFALRLPDGDVLVSGGEGGTQGWARTLERWHSGAWRPAGQLPSTLAEHQALALRDGGVLLLGRSLQGHSMALAWHEGTAAAIAIEAPLDSGIARLADGRLLLAGGLRQQRASALASVFDPAQGGWTGLRPMHRPRSGHRALALRDGRVLVVGGTVLDEAEPAQPADAANPAWRADPPAAPRDRLYPAEWWDPASGRWTTSDSLLLPSGALVEAVQLADGRVLLAGIPDDRWGTSEGAIVRYWDPLRDQLGAPTRLAPPRPGGRLLLLADGQLALVGGPDASHAADFDLWSSAGGWRSLPAAPHPLNGARLLPLQDGQLLAWQAPRSDTEPATLQLWGNGRGWTTLALPLRASAELLRSPELAAQSLGNGDLLVVAGGRSSWAWIASAREWRPIAQETGWSQLLALVAEGQGDLWALHVPEDDLRPFPLLRASLLDLDQAHWRTSSATGYGAHRWPALVALDDDTVMAAGGGSAGVQLFSARANRWRDTGYLAEPIELPQGLRLGDGHVMVTGYTQGNQPQLLCSLWDPADGAWSECGRLPLAAEGRRRAQLLRALPEGRVLLVYGQRQAMVWERGAGWTTTRLRLPTPAYLPPGAEAGTPYLTPFAAAWDEASGQWMDATDALVANELQRPVARVGDGSWLALSGPFNLARWDAGTHTLFRADLQPDPVREELDTVLPLPGGCVVAWNSALQPTSQGSVSSVYVGDLAAKRWRATRGLALLARQARGQLLPDGTLLLAGSSDPATDATPGYQRLHAGCDGLSDLDHGRGLLLPVAAPAPSADAQAGGSPGRGTARARPAPTPAGWWPRVRALPESFAGHLQGKLLAGLLALWLAGRLAQRRWHYVQDESGRCLARSIDGAACVLGPLLWIATLGLPGGWTRWVPASLCALWMAVAARRLHANGATRAARAWLAALALLLSAAAILTLGTALTEGAVHLHDTIIDGP